MSKPLRISEAAHYIGVSKSYLYKLAELKKIPHYKPTDGSIYFSQEDLEAYVFRHKTAADYEMNESAEKIIEAGRKK
jgi:excisionase family DNA binding protein